MGQATPPDLPPGLLEDYLAGVRAQLGVLAGIAARLAVRGDDREALDALRREAHRIHGSAGSYGFAEASRLAAGMEATAKDWAAQPGESEVDRAALTRWFVGRVTEMLKLDLPRRVAATPERPPEAARTPSKAPAPPPAPRRLIIRRPSTAALPTTPPQEPAAPPIPPSQPVDAPRQAPTPRPAEAPPPPPLPPEPPPAVQAQELPWLIPPIDDSVDLKSPEGTTTAQPLPGAATPEPEPAPPDTPFSLGFPPAGAQPATPAAPSEAPRLPERPRHPRRRPKPRRLRPRPERPAAAAPTPEPQPADAATAAEPPAQPPPTAPAAESSQPAAAELSPAPATETKREAGEPPKEAAAAADVSGVAELIVVEDDAALAELLEYGLRARGYRFLSFRNGRDALRELLALEVGGTRPLVLLDVDLPGLDGYSVFDALERDRPGTYRVVFTTVHDGEAEQLRGLEAGALDYLVKPISLRVALEKIRRWVGR